MTKSTVFSENFLYHPLPASWKGDLILWKTYCILFERITQPFLISLSCYLHPSGHYQYKGNFLQLHEEWQTAEKLKVTPKERSLDLQGVYQMEVHHFLQMDCMTEKPYSWLHICTGIWSLLSTFLDWQWGGDAGKTRAELFHILMYC